MNPSAPLYVNRNLADYEQEMYDLIVQAETEYQGKTSRVGFDTGWPVLNYMIGGGIRDRLYLIAGASSHGKTAWMLQMARQISNLNDDAYCLFISLDDAFTTVFPRIIASEMKITTEVIDSPLLCTDKTLIKAREEGLRRLVSSIDRFKILGQETVDADIDNIVSIALAHKKRLQEVGSNRKVILFIDKLHDIKTSISTDEATALKHITLQLKQLASKEGIPVILTAELKKSDNNRRRPNSNDIRETVKTEYTSDVIFLVYNEYKVRKESSVIYTLDNHNNKQPVLEVEISKNKINGKEGILFYRFLVDYCYLEEFTREQMGGLRALRTS